MSLGKNLITQAFVFNCICLAILAGYGFFRPSLTNNALKGFSPPTKESYSGYKI